MYDIIVIGAGTAGLTAAIYGKRAGKSVLVYEGESYGGQILTAPEVANYPGIKNISGYAFATGLFEQAKNLGTEFNFDQVTGVTGSAREGFTVTSELGSNFAKTIIIACGARHRHMGIDDEERFSGVGVSYCSTCDGAFFKGRRGLILNWWKFFKGLWGLKNTFFEGRRGLILKNNDERIFEGFWA